MRSKDIPLLRLANQRISYNNFSSVKQLVGYMGAVQAQDYPMAKWAIGLRLNKSDEKQINSAIEKGEILRTHLLRPTWHFVSADDIYWILELTASRIRKSMSSRNKELGLTPAVFTKSNKIIREALAGNNHLTRDEIIGLLNNEKIKTDKNRASHLLAEAELSGIICSGIPDGDKPTYAILEERAGQKLVHGKVESLRKLAELYFASRGPATIMDFIWWSGLATTDAKRALEMIKPKMNSFGLNSQTYWFFKPLPEKLIKTGIVYLLPAYDEFMISYKDRSAIIVSGSHKKIISNHGMFRAIIIYNGKIIGTWKRNVKNNYLSFKIEYLIYADKKIKNMVNDEAERFGIFTGKQIGNIEHSSVYRKQ